jgi:hypothetical protein
MYRDYENKKKNFFFFVAGAAAVAAAAAPAGGAALRVEPCPPGTVLAGLLAGAWGRPAAVAAAAAAVPLAALLTASEVADPLARGSPAHVNGYF